jgi:hypothetical protein
MEGTGESIAEELRQVSGEIAKRRGAYKSGPVKAVHKMIVWPARMNSAFQRRSYFGYWNEYPLASFPDMNRVLYSSK